MKCPYCENPLPPNVNNCPSCGAPVEPQAAPENQQQFSQPVQQQQAVVVQKSPGLAQFLSCLCVGAGQMYNGQVGKGLAMLIGAIVIGSFTAGIASFIFWLVAIADAGKIAKKINSGAYVGPWEF